MSLARSAGRAWPPRTPPRRRPSTRACSTGRLSRCRRASPVRTRSCAASATTSRSATGRLRRQLGGAAVFRAPFDVPGARVAAIADPAGAVVSLWQPRLRIGATLVNDVGALCWNELATAGLERAKTFFGALLGWQYQASDGGSATITNAGRRNGSIRELTGQERGTAPHWLPYFTVGDADDAARHAGQAGGRTLVPPTGTRAARIAVIADPQGATFTVYEGQTDP